MFLKDLSPAGQGICSGTKRTKNTSIVDQNVDCTEGIDSLLDDLVTVGDTSGSCDGLSARWRVSFRSSTF
jgi:hypothetical protein